MVESNVPNHFKSMLENTSYRNEFKYVLPELVANQIDTYIQPFMNPDTYGRVYDVHSVYLDSQDLKLFEDSDTGKKNRFKLRLRTYGESSSQPILFEIKERTDRAIRKFRSKVDRDKVVNLISHATDLQENFELQESPELALFMQHARSIGAHATAMVSYERTAYVSAFGDGTRITLDRNIRSAAINEYSDDVWNAPETPLELTHGEVVVEIKTNDMIPQWVNEMVQHFEITRRSFSKYVIAVRALQSIGSIQQGSMT
jgi:hypothetical protein